MLDSQTGELRGVFQSLDPHTDPPPDVLTGFLPPEDGTGRGQGHVSYTIQPRANLPTGTSIRNIALITFGGHEAIATNQVDPHDPSKGTDPAREAFNTIDAVGPTSSVSALATTTITTNFLVEWSGQDDAGGSGVGFFDVFVSIDNGPFALWLGRTIAVSATFAGSDGHTYGFYSVAVDNVGHRQPTPLAAQATTRVTVPAVNHEPAANDDLATTNEDTPVTIAVLANDTDADGDALVVSRIWPRCTWQRQSPRGRPPDLYTHGKLPRQRQLRVCS